MTTKSTYVVDASNPKSPNYVKQWEAAISQMFGETRALRLLVPSIRAVAEWVPQNEQYIKEVIADSYDTEIRLCTNRRNLEMLQTNRALSLENWRGVGALDVVFKAFQLGHENLAPGEKPATDVATADIDESLPNVN
jgi:hypothetical protein